MAAPKSTKRQQTAQIQIRTTDDVKARLERGAKLAEAEIRKLQPGANLGVGPWLVGVGLRELERLEKPKKP
jgi:hypothetical protein